MRKMPALPKERTTLSTFERQLYRSDLAAVPDMLSRRLFRTLPDMVVRPKSTDEVAAVMRYATEHRLPVTPRAAATTAYYNAVPVKGGILLDMTALRGIVDTNRDKGTVTVLPATRWKEMDDELRYRWGYAVKSYPTSAPASTIGGWLNTGGWGIGSLRYGCMHGQAMKAEVVLPDGEVLELTPTSHPPLPWFGGSEGTLGVITRLEIGIRPISEAESHHLIAFDGLISLQEAALAMAQSLPRPYHLHFTDDAFTRMVQRAGFDTSIPLHVHLLSVHYEGSMTEVKAGRERVSAVARDTGGIELDQQLADEHWKERFSEVRVKRAGPTLLGAEVWLPLDRLAAFITATRSIGQKEGLSLYTYGPIVSAEFCQLNTFFPTNERRPWSYLLALSLTRKLHATAIKNGGHPYGIGVWNTPYWRFVGTREVREEKLRRKKLLDPRGIMNPGKLYAPPLFLSRPFFGLAMGILNALHKLTRSRGEGEEKG